jgi:alkylation response protein AidB-like acyl-CoA dehydrogenase
MRGELTPITEPGARFVELAEAHAADFAARADGHDRDGTFPFENFDDMKQSGFIAAPVPAELGGIGLTSVRDLAVGLSRLGRGDGSTSIAVNMHLFSVWTMQRMWRGVQAGGEGPPAPVLEGLLKGVLGGGLIAAITGTEAGTSIRYPNTEVTPVDGGYLLNGYKIFGTLSPVATVFFVPARLRGDDGAYESVLCMLGRGTEGQDIKDNWDALGMRASGSGDVAYKDVRLPAANVIRSGTPLGDRPAAQGDPGATQLGLLASFLGIAEAAADIAVNLAKNRRKGPGNLPLAERAWMQQLIGEMDIELATARAMLDFNGRHADEMINAYPRRDMPEDVQREAERLHQAAKYVIQRNAISIVDKALTASGGAGYMSKSPLSRLYRDVRAGPFMQPYSPPEALEFIGRVALDQPLGPDL